MNTWQKAFWVAGWSFVVGYVGWIAFHLDTVRADQIVLMIGICLIVVGNLISVWHLFWDKQKAVNHIKYWGK